MRTLLGLASTARDGLIIVTDPGPDPDDVKALLIAAILHKQGQLDLLGVVANGGRDPTSRAALARCILDHVGERDVPVGVGTASPSDAPPMPHEFSLEGFESVDRSRLEDGARLLVRVLEAAPTASVTILLISSLRDFADIARTRPELVLAKVREVAIMGGLVPDDDAPGGYAADAATNNNFDRGAATFTYRFCFEQGMPMTVVSRHIIPMLPMHLARSFADRTECPVMRYLADAQFLGLAGLWRRLCTGELPARCTKQWYFETFCDIDRSTFEARGLDRLGADADIISLLNGYVKPYDVIALMAVLEHTRGLFADARHAVQPAARGRRPVEHRLLIQPWQALPSEPVLSLLRDVYIEVVLASNGAAADMPPRRGALVRMSSGSGTSDPPGGAGAGLGLGGSAMSAAGGSQLATSAETAAAIAAAAAAAAASMQHVPPRARPERLQLPVVDSRLRARLSGEGAHIVSSPRGSMDEGSSPTRADKLRLPTLAEVPIPGPLSRDETLGVLTTALEHARELHRRRTPHALVVGAAVVLAALLACAADFLTTAALSVADPFRRPPFRARVLAYTCTALAGTPPILVCVRPAGTQRERMTHSARALAALLVAIVAAHVRAHTYRPAIARGATTTACASALVCAGVMLWRAEAMRRHRISPQAALRSLWAAGTAWLCAYAGCLSAIARAEGWQWSAAADGALNVLAAACVTWAAWARLRRAVRCLLHPGTAGQLSRREQAIVGRLTPLAPLAPLLGFGAPHERADLGSICHAAAVTLRGVSLDRAARTSQWLEAAFSTVADGGGGGDDDSSGGGLPSGVGSAGAGQGRGRAAGHISPRRRTSGPALVPSWLPTTGASSAARIDAYVCHSRHDSASARRDALLRWAERFEQRHRRPPRIYIDGGCEDLSLLTHERLAHTLVHLASVRILLILPGPRFATQLRPIVQLYCWQLMRSAIDVEVSLAARTERGANSTISQFDTFAVAMCVPEPDPTEQACFVRVVEQAGVAHFNEVVRAYLPAVRNAASSDAALGGTPSARATAVPAAGR